MPAGSDRPTASLSMLESVLDQLACPACRAGLLMRESRLVCTGCRREFPIIEGIPVLIADQIDTPKPQ